MRSYIFPLLSLLLSMGTLLGQSAVTEEVVFSRLGGLITGKVTLQAETPRTPGAEIHYTLDDTEPQTSAPRWTGPLVIEKSTTLRARIIVPEGGMGPVKSRQFLRLDRSLINYQGKGRPFSSNLPLVIVGTYGRQIDAVREAQPVFATTLLPTKGKTLITGRPEYLGLSTMHQRGETSAQLDQGSYTWETVSEAGEDKAETILGMPAESDWVLYSPYGDKSLMRNLLVFSLMRELRGEGSAMRTRFCEVFINTDPSKPVSMADYRGVFVLMEKIKRDKNRVNVAKLEAADTDAAKVTGGYIFRKDKPDDAYAFLTDRWNVELQVAEPEEPNQQQKDYLRNYMNQFEAALDGENFADPATGYASYIDPETFMDNQWFVEITKQIDGYRYSSYFSKDRGRRVKALPLWDYDLSLGNANYLTASDPLGWYHEQTTDDPWYPRLHEDPLYELQYWDRYWTMRRGIFSNANITRAILRQRNLLLNGRAEPVTNRTAGSIQSPAARHFRRWPILGQYVPPNADGWEARKIYQSEVAEMVRFITRRLSWFDQQHTADGALLVPPKLSRPFGKVKPGVKVAIASTSGTLPKGAVFAKGAVYYTTDGSDPRALDGTPQGILYTRAVTIPATMTLKARLLSGAHWGPLAEATYVTGAAPATSRNVAISELMYHAANPSAEEAAVGYTNDSDFDWVELTNISSTLVDLTDLQFSEGIDFDFANLPAESRVLAPKSAVMLVARQGAFALRHPEVATTKILGEFTNSLSNGGERITLSTHAGAPVADFTYADSAPWPKAPDGSGYTLEVADPAGRPNLSVAGSWRVSPALGGSPGEL